MDLDDINDLIKRYDDCYSEGMDHEQGFDFAAQMVDSLGDLVVRVRELESERDDLATFVRRLCLKLDSQLLVSNAMGYLKTKGLSGILLRPKKEKE